MSHIQMGMRTYDGVMCVTCETVHASFICALPARQCMPHSYGAQPPRAIGVGLLVRIMHPGEFI